MYDVDSDYLFSVYRPHRYKALIKNTVKKIRAFQKKNDIDAIAFRGSSGAALAFPVADKLNMGLIHIRKNKGHYGRIYEGVCGIESYIIIDDFICSGKTIKTIIKHVTATNVGAKLAGIFLYDTYDCDIADNADSMLLKVGQPDCKIFSTKVTSYS